MTEKEFINEISRRFPNSDIETLEDAINRIIGTEYEYIFSEEIATFNCAQLIIKHTKNIKKNENTKIITRRNIND